ncbi:MAG: hypothetical protein WC908_03400 [Candidatus Paceibacterota bacterium]
MAPCFELIGRGMYRGLRQIEFGSSAWSVINRNYADIISKELPDKKAREESAQKDIDDKEAERVKQREERGRLALAQQESALKKLSASLEKQASSISNQQEIITKTSRENNLKIGGFQRSLADDERDRLREDLERQKETTQRAIDKIAQAVTKISQESASFKERNSELQRLLVSNELERSKEALERKKDETQREIDKVVALHQTISGPIVKKWQEAKLKAVEGKIIQAQEALSKENFKTAVEISRQACNALKEIEQTALEYTKKDNGRKYGVTALVKALDYIKGWTDISVQSVDKTDPKGAVIIRAKHISSGATVTMEYTLDGSLKIQFNGITSEDQAHSEQDALVEAIQKGYGIKIMKTSPSAVPPEASKPVIGNDKNKRFQYDS